MRIASLVLLLSLAPLSALADEAAICHSGAGAYLSGVVVSAPKFAHGRFRKGVELSHTHLRLRADQDGRVYDVAIDNVFATGYDQRQSGIPAPVNGIRVNDRIEACGALYTKGDGIHWVHPTCGRRASSSQPNGWLKRVAPDGTPSENFEGSTTWCPLFKGGYFVP